MPANGEEVKVIITHCTHGSGTLLAHILEEQVAVNSHCNWDQFIIPKCLAKSKFLATPQSFKTVLLAREQVFICMVPGEAIFKH